jgi:hypothetical protein
MSKDITISFDFDGCLSTEEVQIEARKLIKSNYNVIITTSRMRDHKNQDLFNVAENVGIEKVIFTNFTDKAPFMYDVDIHIDNDDTELLMISRTTSCEVINNTNVNWKEKLHLLLDQQ